MSEVDDESLRLVAQKALDADRSSLERNRLGQFATPPGLAADMVSFALGAVKDVEHFLEPSCGSGAFLSAFRASNTGHNSKATGVELDPRFANVARDLWGNDVTTIINADYFDWLESAKPEYDFVIANPPYVRHHHLDSRQKERAAAAAERATGIRVPGLAGLYVYFLLASHAVLAPGGVSAWLIPTEFMDVNYGKALRQYLSSSVELIRVHRFDASDTQFADALVSSAVVVFKHGKPGPESRAVFSLGGTVRKPAESRSVQLSQLKADEKWIRHFRGGHAAAPFRFQFGDLFTIRRGIATGGNKVFIRPRQEFEDLGIKTSNLQPILPASRHLVRDVVERGPDGWPLLEHPLALVNAMSPPQVLREEDPALFEYLQDADRGESNGYLARQRTPWYRQEQRPAPLFVCTYMGRGTSDDSPPTRFILNRSDATATNGYLCIYPKTTVGDAMSQLSNGDLDVLDAMKAITGRALRDGGRSYGGGLHKLEPRELASIDASHIADLLHLSDRGTQLTFEFIA